MRMRIANKHEELQHDVFPCATLATPCILALSSSPIIMSAHFPEFRSTGCYNHDPSTWMCYATHHLLLLLLLLLLTVFSGKQECIVDSRTGSKVWSAGVDVFDLLRGSLQTFFIWGRERERDPTFEGSCITIEMGQKEAAENAAAAGILSFKCTQRWWRWSTILFSHRPSLSLPEKRMMWCDVCKRRSAADDPAAASMPTMVQLFRALWEPSRRRRRRQPLIPHNKQQDRANRPIISSSVVSPAAAPSARKSATNLRTVDHIIKLQLPKNASDFQMIVCW